VSDACCSIPSAEGGATARCPGSGTEGTAVEWTTVAALIRGPVPPRQDLRLCRDRDCEVVYYGTAGARITVDELTVRPGFKAGGDGLLCYCFLHREADVARQLEASGETDVLESIQAEVRDGQCACEVRNPSGKCCLGEVQRTIRRLETELGVEP